MTTTKTIKAIIIDPIARFVAHCDIDLDAEGSSYEGLRDTVFRRREQPGYLEGVPVGGKHSIYIDEEGLLTDWDSQGFFCLGGKGGSATILTVAGVAVLVGDTADGDTAPCTLPLELVESMVTWLHPKEVRVPAPFMMTRGADGKEEKTLLGGAEFWTYENQPT